MAQLLQFSNRTFTASSRPWRAAVTVRLLDPLHEFLPSAEKLAVDVALLEAGIGDVSKLDATRALLRQVRNLQEANPMLGNRGCRLGLMYPEIYQMQVEAILNAAAQLLAEGIDVKAEIMIPLVSHVNELESMQELVASTRERVAAETGKNLTSSSAP